MEHLHSKAPAQPQPAAIQYFTVITVFQQEIRVDYPNNGQKLEIETYKQYYSGGTYSALAMSTHSAANEMLDIIDAFSYFVVLLPTALKEKLTLQYFKNIHPVEAIQLRQAFLQYYKYIVEVDTAIAELIKQTSSHAAANERKEQ